MQLVTITTKISIIHYFAKVLNVTNKYGNTPLGCAIEQRNLLAVKELLSPGANMDILNVTNRNGNNAFHMAASIGNLEIFEELIKHIPDGVGVDIPNKDGYTPLYLAAYSGCLNIVKLFLDHGANRLIQKGNLGTALQLAHNNRYLQIVRILIQAAVTSVLEQNVDTKIDAVGHTLLHWAAAYDDMESVGQLLKKGADLNKRNHAGHTPLHLATKNDCKEVTQKFLKHNNVVVKTNCTYKEHSFEVVFKNKLEIDINAKTNNGNSSLHLSAQEGYIKITKMLIDKGADKTAKNRSGITPLACALSNIKDLTIQKDWLRVFDTKDEDLGQCSICLDPLFSECSENMVLLDCLHCGHIFHADCIANSIKNNIKTCPNCRAHIIKSFS